MRRWILIWAAILGAFNASGQSNVLTGTAGDYGLAGQTGVTATLTLLYPNPRTSGSFLVRQDPMTKVTSSTGAFRFTNVLWGKYQLALSGRVATPFTFWVGTNTTGEVAIASLVTNAAAIPPNPATNYYTQAQIDALLAGIEVGGGAATNAAWPAAGYGVTATTNGLEVVIAVNTNTMATRAYALSVSGSGGSTNVALLDAETNAFSGRIEALSLGVDSMTIGTATVDSFEGDVSGGTNANPTNLFAAGSYIPPQFLGSGELTGTRFLKVDGTWTLIEGGGDMLKANNLSDVADAGASRTNLAAHLSANLKGAIPNENLTSVISTNFSWWDGSGVTWASNNANGIGIGVAAATGNSIQTVGAAKFGGNIIGANGAKIRNRYTTNWVMLASSGTQASVQIGGSSDPSDSYPALVNVGSALLVAGGMGGTNTDAAVMGGFALQSRDASPVFFTGFAGGSMLWSDGTNLMATTKEKTAGTLATNKLLSASGNTVFTGSNLFTGPLHYWLDDEVDSDIISGPDGVSPMLSYAVAPDTLIFARAPVGSGGSLTNIGTNCLSADAYAVLTAGGAPTTDASDLTTGTLAYERLGTNVPARKDEMVPGDTSEVIDLGGHGTSLRSGALRFWDTVIDDWVHLVAAGGGLSFPEVVTFQSGLYSSGPVVSEGTNTAVAFIGDGFAVTNIPQRNITRTNDVTMTTTIALAYPFASQLLTMTDNVSVTGYTWAGTNTVYGTLTATNSSGTNKTLTLPAGTVMTTGSRVLYVTNLLELNVKISGLSTSAWASAVW